MKPEHDDQQTEVNFLLRRAWFNAIFWTAGIGSFRAIGYSRKAMRLIQRSSQPLTGMTRAKLVYRLGVFGVAVWLPFATIGIAISIINR